MKPYGKEQGRKHSLSTICALYELVLRSPIKFSCAAERERRAILTRKVNFYFKCASKEEPYDRCTARGSL
jgi:hypothetical protein